MRAYHKSGRSATEDQEGAREADLVSQRIAEVLAKGSFALIPEMPRIIHRQLFRDLPSETHRAGEHKLDALVKQEEILNGDSVLYADPALVEQSLRHLVDEEREANPLPTDTGKMEVYSLKKANAHNFINGGFGGEGAPSYVKVPALPKYLRAPNDYQSSFADWDAKKPGAYPVQLTSLHYPRRIHSEFDDLPWLREAFAV